MHGHPLLPDMQTKSVFPACACCPCPVTGHSWKDTSSLWIYLCIAENPQASPKLKNLSSPLKVFHWTVSSVPMSLVLGRPELRALLQLWPPQGGVEGNLPQFVANCSPYAARWSSVNKFWGIGLFLPRFRTLHFPMLTCIRLSAHFASWWDHRTRDVLAIICKPAECTLCQIIQIMNAEVEQYRMLYWPKWDTLVSGSN